MYGWVAGIIENKAISASNQVEVEVEVEAELGNRTGQWTDHNAHSGTETLKPKLHQRSNKVGDTAMKYSTPVNNETMKGPIQNFWKFNCLVLRLKLSH